MTLCVFALIASEFMPVSLLTPMAADLLVSEGLAGYGIAISGAVTSVLGYGEESVSVSFEKVCKPDIVDKPDQLYKKPGYRM